MQNSVRLLYRDRWREQQFSLYEYETVYLHRAQFCLQVEPTVTLQQLHINGEVFHTFDAFVQSYTFSFTAVKPHSTVHVSYSEDGEQQECTFLVDAHKALLPTDGSLKRLEQYFQQWQREVFNYVEERDAKKIELGAFYTNEDWAVTLQQLKSKLQTNDARALWYYVFCRDIVQHLQAVLRKPKVTLISEEQLVNASELDIITPATITHFMKDTTTWARSSVGRPMPQQLLKEVHEESINVYENRFIYTFVFHLEREMRPFLKELRQQLSTIRHKKAANTRQIALNILREAAELENLSLEEYEQFFEEAYRQLKSLYNLVRQAVKTFRSLKLLGGHVQANQVLLYNKNYNMLYRLYNQYMRTALQAKKKQSYTIDYERYYIDEVFFTMVYQLQQEGFYHDGPPQIDLHDDITVYPFADTVSLTFTYEHAPITVTITRTHIITYVFEHVTEQTRHEIIFVPALISFEQNVESQHIDALYAFHDQVDEPTDDKKKRKKKRQPNARKQRDIFVVYPAGSAEHYNDNIRYEHIHRVVTLGTNFIEPAHFEQFGNMKYGVFPYMMSATPQQIFKRFIRLQLARLNVHTHCFLCGAEGQKHGEEGDYTCSNIKCGSEWGTRTCQCGAPLYKMLKRSKMDDVYVTEAQEAELREQSDVNWLFGKETINAQMALTNICENANLGTSFFTICPNCGDCKQQSKQGRICRRCDALERCQQR